ncbi:hypothetical protein BESB_004900 [Besnoitia besnoiti]|uniref:EF-hand domain-containing protein n=1 Tax=Besnoitia besnoiti TaxID=94643 RepID=A0A2A9MJQ9_BESBE|nr:hypothetical protein BESB_004900 [Besnoitia besnoiti]PFH38149.1 hypothetical protein BESB_004900 [Besnoitia besnoiti]
MGNGGSSQAPVWVAPTTITASTSPLSVLRRLSTTSAVNCIGRYRSQSQTIHIFDAGSLEDLCDDLASECKQFADPEVRRHLVGLFVDRRDRRSHVSGHDSGTGSRASLVPLASPQSDKYGADDKPAEDSDEPPLIKVDALAILSSVLLLSDGPLLEKLEHCVRLLCWTQELEVEPASVFLLLAAAARGVALLTQETPPSVVLIGELLSRLERNVTVTTAAAKFAFEANETDPQGGGPNSAPAFSIRQTATSTAASSLPPAFFAGLPSAVFEMLLKLRGQVWSGDSVWEALAADAAVQAYHDRVTQVFFSEQIEERFATLSNDFTQMLRRICNPEACRAEQHASASAAQQPRHSVARSSRLSKLSGAPGGGPSHDLTPLSWKQVNLLLSCCGSKAVNALLLDEMQFEASVACHEAGVSWKKWVDEPVHETFGEDDVGAEMLGPKPNSADPPPGAPGAATSKTPSKGTAPTQVGETRASATTGAAGNTRKSRSQRASAEASQDEPHTAPAAPVSVQKRASIDPVGVAAGASTAPGGSGEAGETPAEGSGGGERVTFAKPAWKFVASSGSCVWSDDLQLFITPLLAFSALDCHGEGVISSRHVDMLLGFLKQLDPVHGGFYSRLEKVLAADTRALFSIPSDAPDPFIQLKAELSPGKQQIRLLKFAVIMAVCAAIQDRRQHETSLSNRFRRFDVDKSGFILAGDMQLLLTEMIRQATDIDDASKAIEQALQNVVEKYMTLLVGPAEERVDYARFLSAYDKVRKTTLKMRAEIMELAALFEPEPARRESRPRQSELKVRHSSSSNRIRQSLLRKNSRVNKGSSKSTIITDEGIRNLFGKK